MPLTGCLLFVYICIDVGDPVEGRVGMPLTGSLMFVYICIDVGDPEEGRCWDAINR
jgi:transketolase N-terminal domain/subunit